jgi:hypothetical protein
MPPTDPFHLFTNRLNDAGVRYAVTGSVAGMIYGEPRLTQDVDIVLEVSTAVAEKIPRLFSLEEFYCPPVEVLRVEGARRLRGHFNLIHHETGYKADFYVGGGDPLNQWALDSARKFEVEGNTVWIAPPEYVIVRKLEYFREGGSEKHLRDIRGILKVAGAGIDMNLLEQKVAEQRLGPEWKRAAGAR